MWNTTEQLDHISELKDEWRSKHLFTSEGKSLKIPQSKGDDGNPKNIANRAGSISSDTYDRLSVVLSDMARFILCHRFGGIYLDADTIFLRDWEELWGWKGAFAYRWSRLERYNTAVLHLNKNSALGSFIFKTALKNKMDFHPNAIWKYVKDAHLHDLLLRLPDALFDSAWLNTEGFQLKRPPQPFFTESERFRC
jgi:WD repeat and SOF domain-containing protein 1